MGSSESYTYPPIRMLPKYTYLYNCPLAKWGFSISYSYIPFSFSIFYIFFKTFFWVWKHLYTNFFLPIASQEELDEHNVPFFNRDKCAAHLINYYKCLDKGTSFCNTTKDEFYKCQYLALKERLDNYTKAQQKH